MNWIPKNLKELGKLADQLNAEKHPLLPPHALVKKRFKDTTANDLTKTIIWDMYHVRAWHTESTTAPCTTLKVYRKGVRKGVPTSSDVNGRFFGIEVKVEKTLMHEEKSDIEIADTGSVYFIAKSYDDYLNKIAKYDSRLP